MRLSISKIKMFKSCRRQYELHYVEGLSPRVSPEALETGKRYHEILAGWYEGTPPETEYTKEFAMAEAYFKYIGPQFQVVDTEKFLQYDLGNGDTMIGYADGIADDGCIVEHKTTSGEVGEGYLYDLQWDEQILAYMLMTGARDVYYTVIRKPTIRLCKNETEEEFYHRCIKWYDEDTDHKLQLFKINRTDEEVEEFRKNLFSMLDEMKNCKNFYRNQNYCNMWGRRCEYAPVCLHYDPEMEYADFIKEDV